MKYKIRFFGASATGQPCNMFFIPLLVLNRLAPVDPLWCSCKAFNAARQANRLLPKVFATRTRKWLIRLQNVPLN